MSRDIRKVVVLGANGAMGAGSGEVFAAAGIPTVLLARTRDKALTGQQRAENMAKATALSKAFTLGSYAEDLEREVAEPQWVQIAAFLISAIAALGVLVSFMLGGMNAMLGRKEM